MNDEKLASSIIEKVGGKGNIEAVVHCATRLRFTLKDESVAQEEQLKAMNKVLGVIKAGGQFQVIIGNEVSKVYDDVESILQKTSTTKVVTDNGVEMDEDVAEIKGKLDTIRNKNKEKLINRISRMLMNTVYPLVPTMAAVGVFKGLLALLVLAGLLKETDGTYIILAAANDGFLYFMPIMIAISTAKFMKSNPYIAAAIASSMVLPAIATALSGEAEVLTFLGITVPQVSYGNSLFPMLIGTLIAAKFEFFLDKYIPQFLEFIKIMIVVVVMIPIMFLALGPVFTEVGKLLGNVVMGMYGLSPILAGLFFGAFWQVCVMFGIHYALIPVLTDIVLREGSSAFNPILGMGVWALAGASLGFALRSKDKSKKALGFSTMTSALFGITEPAIFGVALAYRKPFIAAMISGGLAGMLCTVLGVNQYSPATVGGVLTFGAHMNPNGNPSSLIGWITCFVVAFGIGAILTFLITKPEQISEVSEQELPND
ncbi:PTS transporter subunit EIIC [Enterococcus sp. DIV0187]|uniref:PTS transporter subunit EIIC n=1 Tax=Enterococcus sp. DIV0187 TaxID=2774644 RepID=UPI003F1E853C